MTLIIMDPQLEGTLETLRQLRLGTASIHLYVNDYVPVQTSIAADFTEASFNGYSPFQLSPGDWSEPVKGVDDAWTMTQDAFVFLNNGASPATVYGAYLRYPPNGGDVICACRFEEPLVVQPYSGYRLSLTYRESPEPPPPPPPPVTNGLVRWYIVDGHCWQDTAGTIPCDADGQTIARIDDLSPYHMPCSQSDPALRPIYADCPDNPSKQCVFDGIATALSGSDDSLPVGNGPITVFVVASYESMSSGQRGLIQWGTFAPLRLTLIGSGTGHSMAVYNFSEDYAITDTWDSTPTLFTGKYDGTEWTGYKNGAPCNPASYSVVRDGDPGNLFLGRYTNLPWVWSGAFQEILIYSLPLSGADMDSVNAYLMGKYGIP